MWETWGNWEREGGRSCQERWFRLTKIFPWKQYSKSSTAGDAGAGEPDVRSTCEAGGERRGEGGEVQGEAGPSREQVLRRKTTSH